MPNRIQVRRDTAVNWTTHDPVLATGEIGFEIDTNKLKVGDGSLAWSALGYSIDAPFSTAEKLKLAGIAPLADPNPPTVAGFEKDAGTEPTPRGFSPRDVRDMVLAHAPQAPVASVAGRTGAVVLDKADVGLAEVEDARQVRADFGYAEKAGPAVGDKLVLRDQADGQPKTVDWARIGAPTILSDPYQDRLIRLAANNTDISAALRAAVAAAVDGGTIELHGMGILSRDGGNPWGLQLPAGKSLTIVGRGRGFHLQHAAPASDTDAFTMLTADLTGTALHLESLVFEGVWSRQTARQDVPGARIVSVRGARELRLYGIQAYDGVDHGLFAQDCGLIRVDRCHVERNTRRCISVAGRDVAITHCSALYSREECFNVSVPALVADDEHYVHIAAITDNTAKWTCGIEAASPRLLIARNRLDSQFNWGIRTFTDESGEGEIVPQEISIIDNHIYNVVVNEQCWETAAVNRAIVVDSPTRQARRIRITGNRMAATVGALWNGTSYNPPSQLKRGLSASDDALGMYRKEGWVNAWQMPTTAGREPVLRRIHGLAVVSQSPVGNGEIVVQDNAMRLMRPTETRSIAFVAHKNDAGVAWAIPAAETAWSQVPIQEHFLSSPDLDFRPQKVRLEVSVGATTYNGASVRAQFALSPTGPWADLCGLNLDGGINKTIMSPWINIPGVAVQAPIWIRIVGSRGNGVASASLTQVVVRFCRDGDAPRSGADPLPLARIPDGGGQSLAVEVSAAEVVVAERLLVLRPGVQRVVLPRAAAMIRSVTLQNRSGGSVQVVAHEGKVAKGARFGGAAWIDFAPPAGVPAAFHRFTLSFWASFDSLAGNGVLLSGSAAGAGALEIGLVDASGSLQVYGRSAAGAVVLDQRSVVGGLTAGALAHVVVSCDLTVPVVKIRINGQAVAWRTTGYTPVATAGGTIAGGGLPLRIGGRSGGGSPHTGTLAQVWFAPNLYLDLDVPANLERFWRESAAQNLGWDGTRGGALPALFLNADGDGFRINQAAPAETGIVSGALAAGLVVPGQETAYSIDGDGPAYALQDGRSASFTLIDDAVEISRYTRLTLG